MRLFRSSIPVPEEHRKIFRYLYHDIGWYGVVSGTLLSFLSIFMARLGANGTQIGLINAVPAFVGLLFTLPIGQWLARRQLGQTIFLVSLAQRFFYLVIIISPAFLPPAMQIWTIIFVIFLLSIPGTALTIGFNTLFADLVPVSWRGYVAGIRNSLLSVATTIATFVSGWILISLPFPLGYQVVFGLGFVGSMMSSLYLYRIAVQTSVAEKKQISWQWIFSKDRAPIEIIPPSSQTRRLRIDILKGRFGKILVLLFVFHLCQYLAVPLVPLYWVNEAGFSDQVIGTGQAILSIAVLIGSMQLDRLSRWLGNQKLLGIGIMGMSLYPILTSFTRDIPLYIVTVISGGLAWAMVSGILFNYIYDRIPGTDRAAYMAWYFLIFNGAVLLGSLGGPLIAQAGNLSFGLVLIGALRLFAGAAILIWG